MNMARTYTFITHKKGDKADLDNYRGITLENTLFKALSQVYYNRIIQVIPNLIPPRTTSRFYSKKIHHFTNSHHKAPDPPSQKT